MKIFKTPPPECCDDTQLMENTSLDTNADIFDKSLHSSEVYVMWGGDQIDLIGHDLRYQMKNNCAQWLVQFSLKSKYKCKYKYKYYLF